ncbi:MAG: HAD-IIA family hydrolase [Mesorhizobium sp.]|uniref:HAD-IIA family hydrolase n=1 Tax=Mesorhizobium sp. TaxID=1871066 RepID=UPI000FE7672A|nr:HAD-IIA family hydrolase [Mesorhizobium sp.]RWH94093.1 MAG: HAD-IIA family hydrolase [Mesorhizobium sp.]RWK82723.1 MAG: HAD-IIA family hydrolase [Mesorhizobium sp.]RWL06530.1 MAG: HAD-IIA family hydrolase [Mesorhizobium sp.]
MADQPNTVAWPRMKGIVSDLDGVIYRGKSAIPDAVEAFKTWQKDGIPFCFVTNNSTHTAQDVVSKLVGFGLNVTEDNVVTSAVTAAELIRRTYSAGTRIYVIGAASLKKAITDADLEISDKEPAIVVMGLDRKITHEKLRIAVDAVLKGAVLIGTNPDLLLPTPTGFEPGAGAMLTAVATAARVKPIIVGKPETHMIEAALSRIGTERSSTLMIGDQIPTDIQAGKRAGLCAVLVTTGVPPVNDATLLPPDFTISSLKQIPLAP